jgi:putative intracellular protease/amidase
MAMERRHFIQSAAAALASSPWLAGAAGAADGAAPVQPDHDMSGMPAHWHGKEQIGMVLYPGMTALDLVGPQYMFANLMGATVHLLAPNLRPVTSDTRMAIVPTTTFARAPRDLDILFVPGGGAGTLAAMKDEALLAFVADRGSRARWVTSVCTGSLVLGAAGLLRGYRATSHWVARDLLSEAGAIAVDQRVVQDRNRVTGAGVSAGLDLGLTLVGTMRDQPYAEAVQLLAEYAPEPPFRAGTPATAPTEITALMSDMFKEFRPQARSALRARAPR